VLNVLTKLSSRRGQKKAAWRLQCPLIALCAMVFVAACASDDDNQLATARFTAGQQNTGGLPLGDREGAGTFVGAIVADEPRAALAARSVLESGGTAVDAITALYFNLAVTMPHEAGLGGGGMCLVHDPVARRVTSYEFLAERPRAGGPVAIPGNVRGFALIHAVHGRLPWSTLVAPAEILAVQGHELSRATARELAELAPAFQATQDLGAAYLGRNQEVLREGALLVQAGLAASLGKIRANGPRGFYGGAIAEAITLEAAEAGSPITLEEMRAFRPTASPPQTISIGSQTLSIPPQSTGAGTYMGSLWPSVQGQTGSALLEAARAALVRAGAETDLPTVFGSTAFVVATAGGDAAACAVTMNGPFGTGRLVPGTGIVLARSPGTPGFGLASAFLAPAMVTNDFNGTFFFAGAGSGGPRAPVSILSMVDGVMSRSRPLEAANAAAVTDAHNLVNVIACPDGAPQAEASCGFSADPNGAGVGVVGFPPAIQ